MKNLFSSFRFKLVLSLFLIVIVILGSLYYVVNRTTQSEFRDYVVRGRSNQLRGTRETLLSYYRTNGSWNGADSVFKDRVGSNVGGNGKGPGSSASSPASGARHVALVGPDGRIIASYDGEMVGKKIPGDLLSQGISLELDGKKIGTLLAGPLLAAELDQSERQFLESVNRRIIYAGAVGLAVALLLGWLLIKQLTRPLNKLTRATREVSQGKLDHRVSVDSNDELGELAESFNRMTSSLQESEEIRRRMIGDIAHELRTPLTVLNGEVEAIREGVYEPTDEKLEEIQEDINLLNRLIEDLRELTLAEAGELELNREPVDLAELIRKSTNKLSDLTAESDVELKTDLPEAVPETELDADRILQVINNLVKNAISHTESGEVRISLEEQPEDIVMKITDTGEGIPEDKLEHVFDRFYRVDSSRSGEGGSGLGLSIAKELVRAHGGEIWINSEPGNGTTVSFSLPKN
ncbi:HAMP domain-containing protein [Candidatus Bipolaricaulota bacterium]|nr:HAMP domain-containing protein [Candidatus Bipolaricaulota bacterium]